MFSKILVPLDGSKLAERALEPALALGRKYKGEALLLRVPIPEPALIPSVDGYAAYLSSLSDRVRDDEWRDCESYLTAIRKANEDEALFLRTEVAAGDVAEVILDTAIEKKIDLIVMSTHGYSGITRWVLGSVTEKVLAHAPCPVLIIRSPQPIRSVLIPLDGSELAECALPPGLELATRFDCPVTLLRVVDELTGFERMQLGVGGQDLANRLQDGMCHEAERYLEGLVASQAEGGLSIQKAAAIGPTASRLLDYAEKHNIDLIVMATHGRSGLARWVYGSVTEKVLRSAHCSMLVIRPAKHKLN